MLDIGWSEMAVVVVIALLVVGPKDLPKVLRAVRYWIGKARSMAREFQDGVDELVREAELKELRAEVEDATRDQLSGEFDDLIDPTGNLIGNPDDDVRAPGHKAAAETADAKTAESEPAKDANAGAPAGGQSAPAKPGDGERSDSGAEADDGQATADSGEPRPGQQASRSRTAETAETTPAARGAASASGR